VDVSTTGSVRSSVSWTRAALRGHGSSGRTSPTLSDSPSRRSAASRLVARSQLSAAVRRMNKRQRLSASFTFLIACGLQLDYSAAALNGTGSVGRASLLATGRSHGNWNSAHANGNANYKTTTGSPSVTARRRTLQQQQQQQQQQQHTVDDRHQFTDIRL